MRIYLDFDGVLHAAKRDKLHFEHKEAFEAILRTHPQVQVVISSSWREVHSYEHMRDYFAHDVMHQIIGVTPVLPGQLRYEEIMQHMQKTDYGGEFIVLDDMEDEFPPGWPPLLLCDPAVGLDASKQDALRTMLGKASKGLL